MNFTMKKVGNWISFPPFLFFFEELGHILRIFAPFVDEGLHVCRKCGIETHHLLSARMDKAKSLGMESLPWKKLETVLDELTVLRINGPLADLRTVITRVIEERMADPVEMDTDLVRTTRFKTALYNRHISEALQYTIMRHRQGKP